MRGHTHSRVLRAPADGHIIPYAAIGDTLKRGDLIAAAGVLRVTAPFDGVLRGLIHPQAYATTGLKIGDLDPRANPDHCHTISDKSLAIGGGVLAAILSSEVVREKMQYKPDQKN